MAKLSFPGSLRSVVLRCVSVLMLASASPARRRLLEQACVSHRVRVSGVDEDQIQHPDPVELVKLLAQAKAQAVAQTLDPVSDAEITAVLGCDSVLSFEGQVFGKPSGTAEAIQRWQRMAGRCGSLLTGHCLIRREQSEVLECVETVVRFAPLSQAEIEAYVACGEPLQCAGGFALEGRGALCIDGLDGCYSNVIGMSLPWLRKQLSFIAPNYSINIYLDRK